MLTGFSLVKPAEFILAEIQLTTLDPSRPTPQIPLLISSPFSGKIILSYPTVPGFEHSMQSSGTLTVGTWSDTGAVAGDGAWKRISMPTADPRRFFRVSTEAAW